MATKKVLLALTSHGQLGDTGDGTGYYLPEVTHPYFELADRGIAVEFVSVKGGEPPLSPGSDDRDDPDNARFLDDPKLADQLKNTLRPEQVDPSHYDAILFAGGHGTMWDFPHATTLLAKAAEIYEQGGIVSAVCHGPAALVNLKLRNGEHLVKGKRVAGFTTAEEEEVELRDVVPFLLEEALTAKGAKHEAGPIFKEKVIVDGRLVTGQNPASARGVGRALAELLVGEKALA